MSAENQATDPSQELVVSSVNKIANDGGSMDLFPDWMAQRPTVPEGDPRLELKSFSKGNKLWQLGLAKMMAKTKYPNPESLIAACFGYFEWLEANPLYEAKLVTFEGDSSIEQLPRMRTPTLAGLCLYLGIHRDTWGSWRRGEKRVDLQPVVEVVEQKLYDDKFTGAAAGLLHPMIITRDLGLVEKQQVDSKTTVVIDGDEANL